MEIFNNINKNIDELAQRGVIMPETAMESAYDPAELQKSFLLR